MRINEVDIVLRVYFSLESLPPWLSSADVDILDYFVEIEVPRTDFAVAVDEWRTDLAQYPQR